MPDLSGLPPLREIIRLHELRAEKSLGQNFLLDQNLTDKIVRLAVLPEGVNAIEIGPGPGGLTRSLVESDAGHVTAIEFDDRAVAALAGLQEAAKGKLDILKGDALRTNLLELVPAPRAIVANLPYNISTVLLVNWMEQVRADPSAYVSLTLMFQKEVADRILATPGSKAYGRLSVIVQWLCQPRRVLELPPEAFTPPPKIHSTVVGFAPRTLSVDAPSFKAVEKVLHAAFQQRRKMVRSSLKSYAAQIEAAGIDPTLRAEDLTVENYLSLAHLSG